MRDATKFKTPLKSRVDSMVGKCPVITLCGSTR